MTTTTLHSAERSLSALDAIFTRRSVRAYTKYTLDKPTVRALLDAAVQAPTAMHKEPWEFVVIQDGAALKRYSDRAKVIWSAQATEPAGGDRFEALLADPDFSIFYDASTLIVICGKGDGPFIAADCWLAAENLMLAACAMGLGTCCIGLAVPAMNSAESKAELGLARDVHAVAAIIVGVPSGAAAPVPRKDPHIVYWG
jgi:nitroreductase